MVKSESHIPKLRFKGFSDEWTISKLKDLVINISGNDGRTNLPVLTISAGKGWMNQEDRFSQVIAGNELQNYTLLKKGQLSYNKGNSKLAKYGVVFALKNYDEALVPRIYHSFQTKKGNHNLFIEYLFATKKTDKELAKLITSGARMDGLLNISNTAFMGINICRAISIQEQTKIGNFFQKIDQVIELQQKVLDTARDYKKSMLQKMFPQKGEKVPQIRFDGFSGDWEEFCLDNIGFTFNGLSGKTKEHFGLGFPFITYKQIFANSGIKNFNSCELVEVNSNEKQSLVQYGDIFFTTSSETPEEVGFSSVLLINPKSNTYLNSFCFGVRVRNLDDLVPEFSQYLFRNPLSRKTIEVLAQGSTRFNISKTNLMQLVFFKPKLKEQQKIGAFFQKLDQQIEQQEKKLESYQNLKKAMLQRMFV